MNRRMSRLNGLLFCGCAITAFVHAAAAAAQSTAGNAADSPLAQDRPNTGDTIIGAQTPVAADPAASGAAGDEMAPGDIVVTAQRRAERLEDVPMAVTALSPEVISNAGISSIRDLGKLSAGVRFDFNGGATQPTIRGITALTAGSGFENNVALYIDGFYVPDNITINGDLANIASVEVLKGPQGTLWGRNATGGAILINTKAPSSVLTGEVKASYGRYDDRSLGGYLSGPFTDWLRFSIAGYVRKSDGYNKLLGPDGRVIGNATPLKQVSVRGKLQADITDNLTATIGANYGLSADPRGILFTLYNHVSSAIPPSPPRASQPFTGSYNFPVIKDTGTTREGTLKLEYGTDIGKLTSYTSYARRQVIYNFDFDGSYSSISETERRYTNNTFQQGLDFSVDAIKNLDLVVGATYYRDRFVQHNGITRAGGNITTTTYEVLNAEAYAAYVDATYHVTPSLAINAGGRYTKEDKDIRYRSVRPDGSNIVVPTSDDTSFSAFTPRASIRYEVAPRTNVYASISQGFRSGGYNPTPVATPALLIPFKPEKITSYEVGFKTARSSWLRFDTSVFLYQYKNLQVGVTQPNPTGPGLVVLVSNAKRAKIYGMDAQVTIQPTSPLALRGSLSLLHARYTDFTNAVGNGLNVATDRNAPGQSQNWNGKQMARAPSVSFTLGGDYKFEDVADGDVMLSLNYSYSSSYVLNNPSLFGPLAGPALADEQRYRQGGFGLLNGKITWTDASDHFQLEVYSENILNKKYMITSDGGAFGDYRGFGSPVTYGGRIAYKF